MKSEKLDIIYEDKYIIIVNKPSGLFTISTDKEKMKTLFHQVLLYLKQKHKNNKVFIVHRLDKDTSGLLIFARNEDVKKKLQDNWDKVKREYITIVSGEVLKEKDTIKSYLKETKTLLVYSSNDKNGKLAITEYEKVASNKDYSMLKIYIKTGRKNQIRVHLNDIGHPIVGDKKYGNIKNKQVKRLCLHANYLEFRHPVTNELLKLESKYPQDFDKLIK
ncbi:MAG: RNA pseudouridine synthase [Firmicutes bacterium]|nr:RNA pseudouridine synthase [Bacillota bacterium]